MQIFGKRSWHLSLIHLALKSCLGAKKAVKTLGAADWEALLSINATSSWNLERRFITGKGRCILRALVWTDFVSAEVVWFLSVLLGINAVFCLEKMHRNKLWTCSLFLTVRTYCKELRGKKKEIRRGRGFRVSFTVLWRFLGKKTNTTNEARNMILVLFLELQLLQSAPHPQAVCCLLPSFASKLLG